MAERVHPGAPTDEDAIQNATEGELDLNAEWERQAKILAEHFAKKLGLSNEEYIAGLPRFDPQPPEYRGRFDTPVIVQVPVGKHVLNLEEMLRQANVAKEFWNHTAVDWQKDPRHFVTPEVPYVAWLNTHDLHFKQSPDDVRRRLSRDERGGTLLEGLALYLAHPHLLRNKAISLPGSEAGKQYVPILRVDPFGAYFQTDFTDVSSRNQGVLVAGREIKLGKMQVAPKKRYP